MTDPLRKRLLAAVCLLALAGCACDKPSTTQYLTVSAPTVSSILYPACHGRSIPVIARMEPHGSRVESLRVLVTSRDGKVSPDPPIVRVLGGPPTQGVGVEDSAAVVYFSYPGPCDGNCVSLRVAIPESAPCPYRLRLVPVMLAP